MKKVLIAFLIFFIGFTVLAGESLAYDVPSYDGFVNDYANILSEKTENELESKLGVLASEETGVEIVVVTIETLGGDYLEAITQSFFDTWNPGKKEANNGVILLIALEEREIRIQTGYGSEVFLTDANSGRIIRNTIVPYLKEGDYDKAVSSGVDEIINASKNIEQQELVSEGGRNNLNAVSLLNIGTSTLIFFVFIATYFSSFLGRSKSWWAGGIIGSLLGLILAGVNYALVLGVVGLIFDYILSKNYKKWKLKHKTVAWRNILGGFKSGGNSSSSRISFGGGGSGGGGASGKW